jgi:hypothetical protein
VGRERWLGVDGALASCIVVERLDELLLTDAGP